LKRLLDTWDRNGSTSGPTPWQIYNDDDVCLYETYINPHFWTDLNQILHTSPSWSGGGRRICIDPQYFNFSTFRLILSEAGAVSYAIDGCRRQTPPLLRYIRDATRIVVTSRAWRALFVMHWKRGDVNVIHVCENGNLIRREGSE
jgi:hypothetical protein